MSIPPASRVYGNLNWGEIGSQVVAPESHKPQSSGSTPQICPPFTPDLISRIVYIGEVPVKEEALKAFISAKQAEGYVKGDWATDREGKQCWNLAFTNGVLGLNLSKEEDSKEVIAHIQTLIGGLKVDGKLGPKTLAALANWTEKQMMPAEKSSLVIGSGRQQLEQDKEFQSVLAGMKNKYGEEFGDEIYRVIKRESNFIPDAVNSQSGAVGLFQFLPKTARWLGYEPEQILKMSPAEQLSVYDKYLTKVKYKEGELGVFHAAPKYAKYSPDYVIWKAGSTPTKQNPGWCDKAGNITPDSIEGYYSRA